MRAIQVSEFGGPEVLRLCELDDPRPAGDGVLLEISAAGVNYADTHQTEDSYVTATQLPIIPGTEVVGTTPAGSRVLALLDSGGYAERAVARPELLFALPDGVGDAQALAVGSQGATAWHILRTSAHLQQGESVVVHAGAGGVGSLAIQLARRWGAGSSRPPRPRRSGRSRSSSAPMRRSTAARRTSPPRSSTPTAGGGST